MIRKVARERREYLYRKSLEGKQRAVYEKKRKIREALKEGTELSDIPDIAGVLNPVEEDTPETDGLGIDDEYARIGIDPPKVFITTSRDPSSRLMQFLKEMKLLIPNAERMNRGGMVLKKLVETCRSSKVTDLVILHEHRGEPDGMIICHLPYGPTAFFGLSNTVLRHDIKDKETISLVYPHLVFDNFNTKLASRCQDILKALFPPTKDESKRVFTFSNQNDFISFRHHTYEKPAHNEVELKEIGPRFEMRLFQIKLGTLDMNDADVEWSLRPYTNSAKRRKLL